MRMAAVGVRKAGFQKGFEGILNSMCFRAPKVFGKVLYTGIGDN
jgi:hypothetical protein